MISIDFTIEQIAADCCNVVDADQLRAAGVSRGAVMRRVGQGTMQRHAPGVYIVGRAGLRPTDDEVLAATIRSFGSEAALSHEAAAARHGIWKRPSGVVHVTSRSHRVVPVTHDLVHHRRELPWGEDDREIVRGIPTTSPMLTLTQLGIALTCHQLPNAIDEGLFSKKFTQDGIDAAIEDARNARGIATVRRAWRLYRDGSRGTRSRNEDRGLAGLLAAGIPEPLVNVRGATGLAGAELDFVWPDLRIVVEIDGRHDRPPNALSDQQVDAALEGDGWIILRFLPVDVWKRLPDFVQQVRAALLGRY